MLNKLRLSFLLTPTVRSTATYESRYQELRSQYRCSYFVRLAELRRIVAKCTRCERELTNSTKVL